MNHLLRWMLCLGLSIGTFLPLSGQTIFPEWYQLSFEEFHDHYAFSPFDHQLIKVFEHHHQKAKNTRQAGGGLACGGASVIMADTGDEEGGGMGLVVVGGSMIGLGGIIAMFADVHKVGYSKRSLYQYLHGQKKIPRYIMDQIPDEDGNEWFDGRYQERI